MPDYCSECGTVMLPEDKAWVCPQCGSTVDRETDDEIDTTQGDRKTSAGAETSLEHLSTTESGTVRKNDAMKWLDSLEPPSDSELRRAITPKPSSHTGSTYATEISNIRVTGDPEFIETIAGLFKPISDMETNRTRVEMNLQQIENRDTEEMTDNYALYLSVAERG